VPPCLLSARNTAEWYLSASNLVNKRFSLCSHSLPR